MDHIVVDVEIQNPIESLPNGWDDTHLMKVACAVVYEFQADRFRVYGDTLADVTALQRRLAQASRISGFNTWGFDYLVIHGFSRHQWNCRDWSRVRAIQADLGPKTNDLLRRIWTGLRLDPKVFTDAHKGYGLDAVSTETLAGRGNIGRGDEAPRWYQAGEWSRIVNYCVDDVALTRDLAVFADNHGYLLGQGRRVQLGPEGIFYQAGAMGI